MARYYASIHGNRGEATRMGTPNSGIQAHVRGWDVGVKVYVDVDEYGEDIVLVDRIHEAVWDIKNALSDYLAFAIMQVHDLVVLLDAAPKLELQLSQTSKDWLKHLEEELSTIEVDPDAKTMLRTSIPIVGGNDVPERLQRFAT